MPRASLGRLQETPVGARAELLPRQTKPAMLEMNDPLWQKLDDAFGDRDIPEVLSRLAREWDMKKRSPCSGIACAISKSAKARPTRQFHIF